MRPNTPQGDAIAERFGTPLTHEYNLLNLLSRPEIDYAGLVEITGDAVDNPQVAEQVEIRTKYAGYIDRQQEEISRLRASEDTRLPVDIDYLGDFRPVEGNPEQAEPGPSGNPRTGFADPRRTPAAISLLLIHLKKRASGRQLEQSA